MTVFQSFPPNFEYNAVRAILKDNRGYMWFGTTEGVIRFDGVSLHLYEHDPGNSSSIGNNAINALAMDHLNNLWVGTSRGLYIYNRPKDNFIHIGDLNTDLTRLKDNFISSVYVHERQVWIGTYGDGLHVIDPEKMEILHFDYEPDNPNGLSSNRITCISSDSRGRIWIGSQDGLFSLSENKKDFKRYTSGRGCNTCITNNNVTSLINDYEGNLWIGTKGGLNKLINRGDKITFKTYQKGALTENLSNNNVLSLCSDRRGYLWIGTENGGLNCLDIASDRIRVFQMEEGNSHGLNSNSIWSLFIDNEDRLWIGTFNKGINVLDDKYNKFELYQRNIVSRNTLPENDVKGFAEDNDGNIWIATDGGGICLFNPENRQYEKIIRNTPERVRLANNSIQAVVFDRNENLWVATWNGGIDKLNKSGTRVSNYKIETQEGLGNNNIFTIYEDSEGGIWAGTAGSGLFRYDPSGNSFKQVIPDHNSDVLNETAYITSLQEDSDGSVWVSTLNGLAVISRKDDQHYTIHEITQANNTSLRTNTFLVIFRDSRNRIWLGSSDNGISVYNAADNSFTVFGKEDGLPSNAIRGILEDHEGYLWIMTNRGISKFSSDSVTFVNYTREDGLNSNELNALSCLRTRRGQFFIGGENGFNAFFPEKISRNEYIPPVLLTNLKINNVTMEAGGKDSPLENFIGETEKIKLNYKQSSFTIEFAALNYTRPAKNQFAYKLEGFDEEWNHIGNNRSAIYTNIKPGRYKFMVKGTNNDGVWNEKPAELLIRITPPWWKKWWAKLLYILIFSGAVISFILIRNERIHIRNSLKLEKMAREKEHELNERNLQFFTDIAHEFRTPLSLIIAPLETLVNEAKDESQEQLKVMFKNARRLLHLTNNLMDIRKLEEGITKLRVQKGELIDFIGQVSSPFSFTASNRKVDFSVESGEESITAWFDMEKLETIILNILSNAYKFTPDEGVLKVRISLLSRDELEDRAGIRPELDIENSRYAEISVIDNGAGISAEELPYIFDKFYQAGSSGQKKRKGTGIGLTLTKALVEMHHGMIRAASSPGIGTTITFYIPVDQSAYREDEIYMDKIGSGEGESESKSEMEVISENIRNMSLTGISEEKTEILVVEDNIELREFLVKELKRYYKVIQAEDGLKGIELAFSEIPDLIISDILMPHKNGIELCNTIKSDIRTSHIPVILLTAKAAIQSQIEGAETGADAYIIKPFNLQLLIAKINQMIQTRRKLYAHFSQDVYFRPGKISENEMDQKFLEKATDYIIKNIADNTLNVENLTVELNLSRSNVYRKIKALTGKTIIEFIRIIRLKQAIKLMESKKYSLSEIAYLTGFTSPSYFTKSFKDHYGKPPSEFMNAAG